MGAFQRVHLLKTGGVLDHPLGDQRYGQEEAQREEQSGGEPSEVHPEVADCVTTRSCQAPDQGSHHGQSDGRRHKVLGDQAHHLGQVREGCLPAVVLPVGVGDKRNGHVEGEPRVDRRRAGGIERQRAL